MDEPDRRRGSRPLRVAAVVVMVVIAATVGVLTLGPQPMGPDGWLTRVLEFVTGDQGIDWASNHLLEFAANIALFVPVGVVLVVFLGRRRWWLALILALLGAVSIELVQQVLAGRFSSPRDVLANTAGAAGGILLASVVSAVVERRRSREPMAADRS